MQFARRVFRRFVPRKPKEPPPQKPPWAYPDAAHMLVYFANADFQIVIWFGFEHHWHLLPSLTPRHYVFIANPWHATEYSFRYSRHCLEYLCPGFPISNVIWFGNTEEEVRSARQEGWNSIFVNNNSWLDERVYKPDDRAGEHRLYDLVINCRPENMKRPHLASEIDRLAVIQDICWQPDNYFDLHQLRPLYLNEERLTSDQVVNVLNQSICGGAFSEQEGACYASSEYLLCGLPVVSTPSRGGRDVWYNDRNAVICAPTSAAVREAVKEIKTGLETGQFDRIQIREHHLRLAQVMRDRFNNCVQQIFGRYGVIADAREHLHEMFTNQMFRVIPMADATRLLTMGADAMQAQFASGREAGSAPSERF